MVAGGIVWAAGQLLIKSLGPVGGLRMIAWFAAFVGPQMAVASFLVEDGQWQAVRNATWKGWLAVFYLSLVMTAAAYALWFRLIGAYRMNQVAPFVLLVPVTEHRRQRRVPGASVSPSGSSPAACSSWRRWRSSISARPGGVRPGRARAAEAPPNVDKAPRTAYTSGGALRRAPGRHARRRGATGRSES